jgi:hypothetical protein
VSDNADNIISFGMDATTEVLIKNRHSVSGSVISGAGNVFTVSIAGKNIVDGCISKERDCFVVIAGETGAVAGGAAGAYLCALPAVAAAAPTGGTSVLVVPVCNYIGSKIGKYAGITIYYVSAVAIKPVVNVVNKKIDKSANEFTRYGGAFRFINDFINYIKY